MIINFIIIVWFWLTIAINAASATPSSTSSSSSAAFSARELCKIVIASSRNDAILHNSLASLNHAECCWRAMVYYVLRTYLLRRASISYAFLRGRRLAMHQYGANQVRRNKDTAREASRTHISDHQTVQLGSSEPCTNLFYYDTSKI